MLDHTRIRYLFNYDDETGRLLRIVFENPGEKVVTQGVSPQGYYVRWVDGRCYLEHHLVYFWHTGVLVSEIDHQNRDRRDNRIANLRPCDRTMNNGNQKIKSNNTSGYRGVSWSKGMGKWWAQITCRKQHFSLGYFLTPEESALAYNEAATHYFGEFARLNEVKL